MVNKNCSWGLCRSSSRRQNQKDMVGVTFRRFPPRVTQRERCMKWIELCNRPHHQLNIDKVGYYHYVCSKHFEVGAEDPVSACQLSKTPMERTLKGMRRGGNRKNAVKKHNNEVNNDTLEENMESCDSSDQPGASNTQATKKKEEHSAQSKTHIEPPEPLMLIKNEHFAKQGCHPESLENSTSAQDYPHMEIEMEEEVPGTSISVKKEPIETDQSCGASRNENLSPSVIGISTMQEQSEVSRNQEKAREPCELSKCTCQLPQCICKPPDSNPNQDCAQIKTITINTNPRATDLCLALNFYCPLCQKAVVIACGPNGHFVVMGAQRRPQDLGENNIVHTHCSDSLTEDSSENNNVPTYCSDQPLQDSVGNNNVPTYCSDQPLQDSVGNNNVPTYCSDQPSQDSVGNNSVPTYCSDQPSQDTSGNKNVTTYCSDQPSQDMSGNDNVPTYCSDQPSQDSIGNNNVTTYCSDQPSQDTSENSNVPIYCSDQPSQDTCGNNNVPIYCSDQPPQDISRNNIVNLCCNEFPLQANVHSGLSDPSKNETVKWSQEEVGLKVNANKISHTRSQCERMDTETDFGQPTSRLRGNVDHLPFTNMDPNI